MPKTKRNDTVELLATLLIACGAEEDDPNALLLVFGPWLDFVTDGRAEDVLDLVADMAARMAQTNDVRCAVQQALRKRGGAPNLANHARLTRR